MLVKDNNYKVMKLFFDNPEKKFYIREIARLTGLSAPGVLKILKKLKEESLLESEKGKVVENVKAPRSEKFFLLKRSYNILSLFESGLIDFLKDKYEEPEAIVIFGSYSKGEDTSESDIDIAIVTKKEISLDLKKFEKTLKKKVNIYEIQTDKSEREFLNNLVNGTVVYGYLKVL
ncbi:MAG: nucleotidyltransferase domain-containing protein [Candidatus Aenigmatarchaeota archaeon]